MNEELTRFMESLDEGQRGLLFEALLALAETVEPAGETQSGESPARQRRPRFTFKACRIPVGSVLEYSDPREGHAGNVSASVVTVDDINQVSLSGTSMSLSEAARRLSGSRTAAQGAKHFTYHGRRLTDLREEIGF